MSVPVDLSALPRMSIDELRDLWKEHIGRSPPPVQKRLLIRELAWRIQERAHGGLDALEAKPGAHLCRQRVGTDGRLDEPAQPGAKISKSHEQPFPRFRQMHKPRRLNLSLTPERIS